MVVFAALALILSLLPWFEVSPRLLQLGGVASGAATLLGGTSLGTVLSFEPEYSVWNLISLSGTFNDYVSAFNSYGGSKASGATLIIAAFSWGCLILWLASLVFTIWGAITAFMKGKVGMVRTGSILMVVTVVVFFVFAASMSSDTGVPTVMPVFCLVLSVIAFVLSFFAKNKDAKKAQEDKKVQKA